MLTREALSLFPNKRIRAIDGMAVTADVWEEAHDYHRQLNRLHTVLHHGAGIVTGLEVIASDPADNSVYLLPGMAVDSVGQTIVVPEPRSYDLGNADGRLYLIVAYNESRPQSAGSRVQATLTGIAGANLYESAKAVEVAALAGRPAPVGTCQVDHTQVGGGYAVATDAGREALQLAARFEGLILDPVYSGKGMAGLIAARREGRLAPDRQVVFLHTGGLPALFAGTFAESLR